MALSELGRKASWSAGVRSLLRSSPGMSPTLLIIALLACVLVPLPSALLDVLLSLSLAGSVLLLVASIRVRRSGEFLSFPILLVLLTLFRLALNISTTRLILSDAYAGRVVEAFASIVVKDDMLVGGVMFLIITIIQYVVIAQGSERVAEVAARFALDGLPGHQAAIDSELRAGSISAKQASQRRARLSERSNLYGAMDGAMRFVKGDAIAGLAITAVNLCGGVLVGSVRRDWSWLDSISIFGRLTIGDGLVAQIPALLVSLAAGVLVARVDREDDDPNAFTQWLQPVMLLVPASLLLVLAFMPGMPAAAFVTTAMGLMTLAVVLARKEIELARVDTREQAAVVRVQMPPTKGLDLRRANRLLGEVRARCSTALKIVVPPVTVDVQPDHPPGLMQIAFGDRVLARERVDRVEEDRLVLMAFRAIMDRAEFLLDLEQLDRMLDRVRTTHAVLVRQALEVVSITEVQLVLRTLLRERVPLPPLAAVLETLLRDAKAERGADTVRWVEHLRLELAPYWVHAVLDDVRSAGRPTWIRPTPDSEQDLLARARTNRHGLELNLTRAERCEWIDAIHGCAAQTTRLVVLTTPRARRAFAELVNGAVPRFPVVSVAELEGTDEMPRADDVVHWLAPRTF